MTTYVYGRSKPHLRPKIATAYVQAANNRRVEVEVATDPATMRTPAWCFCGRVYDLAGVTVLDEPTSHAEWVTPCCECRVSDTGARVGNVTEFTLLTQGIATP